MKKRIITYLAFIISLAGLPGFARDSAYFFSTYDFPHNVDIFTPSIEQKMRVGRVRNSSNP